MTDALRLSGQAIALALLMLFIGVFASWPRLTYFPSDRAQLKLSFAHGAERKDECRRLTSEEIAKLPPNQRRPNTCGRERLPIRVQLVLDEQTIYDAVLEPTGLARDGPARVYQKFAIPAGRHVIIARLRDSRRTDGFDYETRAEIRLEPLQSLAIEFKGDQGTFTFR